MRDDNKLSSQLVKAVLGLKLELNKNGFEPIFSKEHISKTGIINSLYSIQKIDRKKDDLKSKYVLIKIKNDELTFTTMNDIQAMFYFDSFGKSYPFKF